MTRDVPVEDAGSLVVAVAIGCVSLAVLTAVLALCVEKPQSAKHPLHQPQYDPPPNGHRYQEDRPSLRPAPQVPPPVLPNRSPYPAPVQPDVPVNPPAHRPRPTHPQGPVQSGPQIGRLSASEPNPPDAPLNGVHSGRAPSGVVDIEAASSSVEDMADILGEICSRVGGRLPQGYVLQQATIRPGIHAAVADCTSRFRTEVTVVFFPVRDRKRKQLKMFEKSGMTDFMPVMVEERDGEQYMDPQTGLRISVPGCVYMEHCTTLRSALLQCENHRDLLQELFVICQGLTRQLLSVHRRKNVLRDITTRNVVRTNMGATKGWTLLEYASATRAGSRTETVPIRSMTPELAMDRLNEKPLVIEEGYDMWQLGMLIYEIAADTPYWPATMTDRQVLMTLATNTMQLPHEDRPVQIDLVQRILTQLLTRPPTHRLTSSQLKALLDDEEMTGTLAATMNPAPAITEEQVEFAT